MAFLIRTQDQTQQKRLLVCESAHAAESLSAALEAFGFPVVVEHVAVFRDPITMQRFCIVDGERYWLHDRSWGAELKKQEVHYDVV
mgnify:CR=1 FL=1